MAAVGVEIPVVVQITWCGQVKPNLHARSGILSEKRYLKKDTHYQNQKQGQPN